MAVESLLTFAAEGILTKVSSLAAQELSLAWGFKDELKKLGRSLSILQDFLGGAAEQAHDRGKAVKEWVNKLNDIAHDADDVLDEINYEALRKQVELQNHTKKVLNFFSSSNTTVFRQKMAHRIRKINNSLAELKGEASFIGLVANKRDPIPQGIRSDRQTNSVIGEKEIFVGREEVVLDIVKTLTKSTTNEESLSVMAIVGMPGLGKTTVARSVYNEDSIDKYFQKKIWVCVSNTFEVNSILNQILESLKPERGRIQGQDALLKFLKEELEESRYLLVLDDVWNEDSNKWDELKSCLSNLSVAGSKIIVTTRSAKVADVVETLPRCNLESISVDDCWSIIKYKALPDNSEDPFAEERAILGKQIAERCAGIPLMAKVLGSILSSKRISEWRSIKESRILNLPEVEHRVISVLRLSFDNLVSPSLKQCFAYCSMFLKDAVMERDNLVQLWMAEGLLLPAPDRIKDTEDDESNLEIEDIGNEYFDVLLQSSLFQDAKTDEYGIVITCKMHDLVHDLAELVSKSERLTGDFQETDHIVKIQQVAQVSSSMLERIRERNIGRLRSLFSSRELPTKMLPGFGGLRVLNLYEAEIQELPTSVGKLKHLRYLNISRTSIKALPTSIGKLYNLQTLRATSYALEEFPKEVLSLINLRHIYFQKSTKFPVGMRQLTHLRTIPPFYVDEDMGRGIEELGGLNELKGDLIIYNLEQVRDGDEARKAELKEKKNVKRLKLVWNEGRSAANNHEEDVAEGLQPHPALESLKIVGFMGAKLPSWLMSRSLLLNNLYKVQLQECDSCEELPSLGHLLNLTTLWIHGMDNLKCLGEEFYGYDLVHGAATTSGRTRALFPALKKLSIYNCGKLFQWVEFEPTSSERVVVFPRLEELGIESCPKLRNLPSHFPSLKKLRIDGNEELTCLPKRIFLNNNNNLIHVEIRGCEKLRHLPDGLDTLALLQTLYIRGCKSLEMIVITQSMPSLRELNINDCHAISILSGLQYCTSLQELWISKCNNLTSIEIPPGASLTSLEKLTIDSCEKLSSLPALQQFPSLQDLGIWNCPDLKSFSSHLCDEHLTRPSPEFDTNATLEKLSIWDCESLHSIPDLQSFTSLRQLTIVACGRISKSLVSGELNIPGSVEEFSVSTTIPSLNNLAASLRTLTISNCKEGILGGLERFARLYKLGLWRCPNLTSIEITNGVPLPSLQDLEIDNCRELSSLPALHHFPSLRRLNVSFCPKLASISSSSISHAQSDNSSLERLWIEKCDNLQSIPDLNSFTSLRHLSILRCGKLQHFPTGLHALTQLKELHLHPFWEELDSFPDILVPSSQLHILDIRGWPKLKSLPTISATSLKNLKIRKFDAVEALPEGLGDLASLTQLRIWNCENLKYLPSVKAMKRLTNLQSLFIGGCPLLAERCKEKSGPEWAKVSHIPDFTVRNE